MKYLFSILIWFGCLFYIMAQHTKYIEIWEDKFQSDSAIVRVENLKTLAEAINDDNALGFSQDMRIRSYYYNRDYVNALKHINQSLKTFKKQGDLLKTFKSCL
tara:strand:- start:22349 stop:22657 length:309 start_codon:yes stop_codon:yes gene_type:complete